MKCNPSPRRTALRITHRTVAIVAGLSYQRRYCRRGHCCHHGPGAGTGTGHRGSKDNRTAPARRAVAYRAVTYRAAPTRRRSTIPEALRAPLPPTENPSLLPAKPSPQPSPARPRGAPAHPFSTPLAISKSRASPVRHRAVKSPAWKTLTPS